MASVIMGEASDNDSGYDMISDAEYDDDSDCGSSEHEEDLNTQPRISNSGEAQWTVLDVQQVEKLQEELLEDLCSLIGCCRTSARTLLQHYRWDKERVVNALADKGQEQLYAAVGLPDPNQVLAPPTATGQVDCEICASTVPARSCPRMLCTHQFCPCCWRQHCRVKVAEGKACNIRCMAFKCGAPCDDAVVSELLKGTPEAARLKEDLATSYVHNNNLACFCPSVPWCGRAVVVREVAVEPECTCGTSFCFQCKRPPHSPCTCEMWDKWEEKTSGDSETRNWMAANTKPCPRCKHTVEKNGGCNHVTCKCGQHFCWLCGAATGMAHTYQEISGHQCGRWKEEMDKKASDAARNHKRYMHYFERYKGHADSYAKEGTKRAELLERTTELVEKGFECRDYSWLVAALEQLKLARGVLANSYVFAYFAFGNDMFKDDFNEEANTRNQNFFEDQQVMLEQEVERLSQLTGEYSQKLSLDQTGPDDDARVKVINSTVNIEQRILKFYDMIQEILDQVQTSCPQVAMYTGRKKTRS